MYKKLINHLQYVIFIIFDLWNLNTEGWKLAENILASSQLTACDILSFPGKVEVDYVL